MLTFSPLTKDGEPVVRPPKKGEWYLRTRDPCVEQAEYDAHAHEEDHCCAVSGKNLLVVWRS